MDVYPAGGAINAALTQPHSSSTLLREAILDGDLQRSRCERLAQATRRAELQRHPQEVGSRRIQVCEGVARQRDQRNGGRAFVKDPDRFKAAHVRHEDIDDHQIELFVFEGSKSCLSAVGDRHPKIVPLEIDLDGHAYQRVVVDNENMAQTLFPRLRFPLRRFNDRTVGHALRLWLESKW